MCRRRARRWAAAVLQSVVMRLAVDAGTLESDLEAKLASGAEASARNSLLDAAASLASHSRPRPPLANGRVRRRLPRGVGVGRGGARRDAAARPLHHAAAVGRRGGEGGGGELAGGAVARHVAGAPRAAGQLGAPRPGLRRGRALGGGGVGTPRRQRHRRGVGGAAARLPRRLRGRRGAVVRAVARRDAQGAAAARRRRRVGRRRGGGRRRGDRRRRRRRRARGGCRCSPS